VRYYPSFTLPVLVFHIKKGILRSPFFQFIFFNILSEYLPKGDKFNRKKRQREFIRKKTALYLRGRIMVNRVVDIDNTYELVLGRKRAFGDEKQGRSGIPISKKNQERLDTARRFGESFDDVLTRILDDYEKNKNNGKTDECIYL
jgi:hypothetical protein